MKPLLEIEGLRVGYGYRAVLTGISIELRGGEILALLGRNGAGKSTLLGTVAGLVPLTEGSIRLEGVTVDGAPVQKRIRMGISYVAQNRECFPDLTVEENIKVAMSCLGLARNQREARLSRVTSLFPTLAALWKDRVNHLSGGQQQMLVLAAAICQQPRILLLDEPSTGLHGAALTVLRHVVGAFVAEGGGVLLVEQNLSVASALANRALYLENGKIEMQGTPRELLDNPAFVGKYLGVPAKG